MDPSNAITCSTLESFLEEVRRRRIGRVVLRTVKEIRPRALAEHRVEVGPQEWVELAAYQGGVLLTARVEGTAADAVSASLRAADLEIHATSGNVG